MLSSSWCPEECSVLGQKKCFFFRSIGGKAGRASPLCQYNHLTVSVHRIKVLQQHFGLSELTVSLMRAALVVDDMVNNWGVNLIMDDPKFKKYNATRNDLDAEIKRSVPGYQLESLVHSGSCANSRAINFAADGDVSRCLIAMGSYVAGDQSKLQTLSSSRFDTHQNISEVVRPSEAQLNCQQQTVAFPYFIPHSQLSKEQLQNHEIRCLNSIEWKLWMAKLTGKRFRALLMEPILSANGGELADEFLANLACLLKRFDVMVILDEVMTGGRVGPTMTMSTGLPSEFLERIGFITMGKIFNCGIVLEKKPSRPTCVERRRGESTALDAGEAFLKWKAIQKYIHEDNINRRRSQVLKLFGMTKSDEHHWGRGCLIFTSKARPGVKKNLKCRLLPKLEMNHRLTKLTTRDSGYSRKAVNDMLFKAAEAWMIEGRSFDLQGHSPFLAAVIDWMIERQGHFIAPADLVEFVGGQNNAQEMTDAWHIQKCHKSHFSARKYKKKPLTYISDVLAEISSAEPNFMVKGRKYSRRRCGYIIDYNHLNDDRSLFW